MVNVFGALRYYIQLDMFKEQATLLYSKSVEKLFWDIYVIRCKH
jgi:hypothetical protein